VDGLEDEEAMLRYPPEYSEGLNPQGLPPHTLNVKAGCIIMLLRNISLREGLCNGTRLRFLHLTASRKIMVCERLTAWGGIVYIPRIKLTTLQSDGLPFDLTRTQFPVKLCFAMSINKSQGQSFNSVGLYLPHNSHIFGHGQLYVALSRCRSKNGIRVNIAAQSQLIANIVYHEVLS
jgi:ATP-dependent DNA helicase PIF1